jgi:hypothetical protein
VFTSFPALSTGALMVVKINEVHAGTDPDLESVCSVVGANYGCLWLRSLIWARISPAGKLEV